MTVHSSPRTWILVASRTGARILDAEGGELSLVETIAHEEGRLHNRDIDSDRQGRAFSRTTDARHALSTSEPPHEHIAVSFARTLADKLRHGRLAERFGRLVLVAEPHFLGLLREALDETTARLVIASVTKDLHPLKLHELSAHLPDLSRPSP